MITHDAYLEHGGTVINNPDTVVVHAMGEYIGRDHAVLFLNKLKLSAHALIAPDGSVYRCRRDDQRAWHARGHNTNSLGIEFLVPGEHDYSSFLSAIKNPYLTDAQRQAGLDQVREWLMLRPIKTITRHSDISPGRKVDPGDGFPWVDFLHDLGAD